METGSLDLSEMQAGYKVDHENKTYTVTGLNRYVWHEGNMTHEWELSLGDDIFCLVRAEKDGNAEYVFGQKLPLTEVEGDVAKEITDHDDPPKEVMFQGKAFTFFEDDVGDCFEADSQEGKPLIAWNYAEKEGPRTLSIEQWGETRFNVNVIHSVQEDQFTNIQP